MMRFIPLLVVTVLFVLCLFGMGTAPWLVGVSVILGALVILGLYDFFQSRHTLWRNFPIIAHIRWIAEELHPFLRSYIVESETEGRPFNTEQRALIYRRAKNVSSVEPFGSHLDIDKPPYEWLAHSIAAKHTSDDCPRVVVGAPGTKQPYSASVMNISAMSFGSLGAHAIEALSTGAKKGNFYHDTGEGGVSRYHRAGGADLVWEIGSGYFGCRARDGRFDAARFKDVAQDPQIKMIDVKLSQGAKPGHGGVLPGSKVTEEIAEARGVPVGETCVSPPGHTAFSTPIEMLEFAASLREMSGGKPVGIKFCVGNRWEILAICKAMLETGTRLDFMVVDGGEGGTGAAPAEFLDHVGAPLRQGLVLTRNALVGTGLKDHVRLACSGKQTSAFAIASSMALGADWINTARGFMFSLGCIQSLNCHNNTCPTGIATTDKGRQRGLVVADKAERVYNFQRNTMKALMEVVGAAGLEHPAELTPRHIMHRVTEDIVLPAHRAYDLLDANVLINAPQDTKLANEWAMAQAASFRPLNI
ncbi:MAG: FMN-binding glutamate synthase family protein [Alphaproteobacteria bacterium]|nr:FMN-binding glutamate synthase family protein [Alphaproteobacteria bacterium]MBU2082475.1 FMN-binding glutamate synthase family protein [Alphaproteobacteria bacterium]MBU2141486.1 FMN-binding glutamate synthase family protein [Alphaproteobacteria bacterium]MBU2197884.1 FMN-binding glutamate synthase family protein [Alphaproteobacteria bacterium]